MGDITPAYIRDHPEELRARSLDVSNVNLESGTGKLPLKGAVGDDEVKRIVEDHGDVVVAPLDKQVAEAQKAQTATARSSSEARETAREEAAEQRQTAQAPARRTRQSRARGK